MFAAAVGHRSGRATPSLRGAPQRQSMEIVRRETIYRNRNAVQTNPATSMVLLKSVVEISARSMPHLFAELGSDRSGIGIMAISGDPIWSDAGHRLGRSKECPGSSKVTMLAQPDVNQSAVAINRPIQIPPSAPHPDIRLINVPAGANPAFASPTQVLGKRWRQLGLPIAHRFVAEDEPASQEHLCQIPQAQLVPQPPEHHECGDIARILRTVEHTDAVLSGLAPS